MIGLAKWLALFEIQHISFMHKLRLLLKQNTPFAKTPQLSYEHFVSILLTKN